jgi:hypothetical protein
MLGCQQTTDPIQSADIVYSIGLDKTEYAQYVPTGTGFFKPVPMKLTVTNTGNQLLTNLSVAVTGPNSSAISASIDQIVSLSPGAAETLTISFPQTDPGAVVTYTANILIGNADAAKKLPVKFGTFNLISPPELSLDPALLQAGNNEPASVLTTDTGDKADKPWFTANSDVIAVDEVTGALTISAAGETVVGYVFAESPLTIKGKKVTVYPAKIAAPALNPVYPLIANVLARDAGGIAAPSNLAQIQEAAAGSFVFTITGADAVISAIDPDTGLLTFAGVNGASANVTVNVELRQTVPEGSLTTHFGSASFTVRIGIPPVPTAVNAKADELAKVELTFSDNVTAGVGNAKNGFTITKNEPAVTLTIDSASITGNTITFTLNASTTIGYGDTVNIGYDKTAGTIANAGGAVESFTALPVTNNVSGTTWYVSPTGDDSNAGISPSAPLLTPVKALALIKAAYADTTDIWPGKAGSNPMPAVIVVKGTVTHNSVSNIANTSGWLDVSGANAYPPIELRGAGIGENAGTLNFNGGSKTGRVLYIANGNKVTLGNNLTLTGGRLSSSGAANAGSGVYITSSGSSFIMTGGAISGITGYLAPAVCVNAGTTFTMTGGAISNNISTNGVAGAVQVIGAGSVFNMSGGSITGNKTAGTGGAVSMDTNAVFNMSGTALINNNEATGNAGAVFMANTTSFNMSGGTIDTNRTGGQSGAVYVTGASALFTMTGGTISNNTAVGAGGAISLQATAKIVMSGISSIINNTSTSGNGGAVFMASGTTFTMDGGTIAGNKSIGPALGGGGVYLNQSAIFTKTGGTIYGRTGNENANNVLLADGVTEKGDGGAAIFINITAGFGDEIPRIFDATISVPADYDGSTNPPTGSLYTAIMPPKVTAIAYQYDIAPTSIVVTFDQAVKADNSAGFSISGSATAISFATGVVVDTGAKTLTLVLNAKPVSSETLRLSYTGSGNVKSDANNIAVVTFSNRLVTVTGFPAAPVVTNVELNYAARTTVVVTFDQAITADNSAGFSISGSATAVSFVPAVSVDTGAKTLTLTLNAIPGSDETLKLAYIGASVGNVKRNDNADVTLAGFTDRPVTFVGFPVSPTVAAVAYAFDIAPTSIVVTFDQAITADNSAGFSISGSSTATSFASAVSVNSTILTLTLNAAPANSEIIKLSYIGSGTGNVKSALYPEFVVVSFTDRAISVSGFPPSPKIKSATIGTIPEGGAGANDKVRVVFDQPVTVDASKFKVRAQNLPIANLGVMGVASSVTGNFPAVPGAPLLYYGSVERTMSSPVGNTGDTIWDFTISAPAAYGEILVITTESGAARRADTPQVLLPGIPQLIVKNGVTRVKQAYESVAGFYKNGVKVDSVTADGLLYKNAIVYLTTAAQYPQPNDVYTIVLDQDQTYVSTDSFTNTHIPTSVLTGGGATLIITTNGTTERKISVTGAQAGLITRNGLTVIIDEYVAFDKTGVSGSTNALIVINDGGKLILDGGEIRGNVNTSSPERAGGVRMGGGSYGAYFIMNSGKITGNSVSSSAAETTTNHGGAGGIYMQQFGTFVMHGGEITNNTVNMTGTVISPKAGAISVRTHTTAATASGYHANASIFITGGTISGNTVQSAKAFTSAGAIYTNGAFQKTGGTISGNTSSYNGAVNADSVVIGNTSGSAAMNAALNAVTKRNTDAGPAVLLFVDSYKTSGGITAANNAADGVNSISDWAESNWD